MSGAKDKAFIDMLARTVAKGVDGSWQNGRYRGAWWLDGEKTGVGRR
jgi:hypothetical protein